MKWLGRWTALGLWIVVCGCGDDNPAPNPIADCVRAVEPIRSGFGAEGPYDIEAFALPNPIDAELRVTLHVPRGQSPAPLVVFGHGNGLGDPASYAFLIRHIVSRGYAVVYAEYANRAAHADRYAALWSGLEAALEKFAQRIDLTRVGFVGHSYGAGALPALAQRALVEQGWGTRGAFLFAMAPWYALETDPQRGLQLPDHLRALILSFDADDTNDPRIAIDLYRALELPVGQKSYLTVRSDAHAGCNFVADHAIPQTAGLGGRHDPFDVHAVARLFDALAAAAFDDDPAAQRVAFGAGSTEQIEMGDWADGTPFATLVYSADPKPSRPESFYRFKGSERDAWERYPVGPTADGAAPAP